MAMPGCFTHDNSEGYRMRSLTYKLMFGLAAVGWVCIATTMCGCRSSTAWVANKSGHRAYRNGDYIAARRSFQQALADRPFDPDYAYNVASAMHKQGDSVAAERMYTHALTLNPSHQPSYHGYAQLLTEDGRDDEAEELLIGWTDTQPEYSESDMELAWLREEEGDYYAAEQTLGRALRKNPRHPRALAQMGDVYAESGRPRDAMAMYRRSLASNPAQPRIHSKLNQLYARGIPDSSLMMAQQMPYADPTMAAFPPMVAGGRYQRMGARMNPYGMAMQQQQPYQMGTNIYGPQQMGYAPQQFGYAPQPTPQMGIAPQGYPQQMMGAVPQGYAPQAAYPTTPNAMYAPNHVPQTTMQMQPGYGSVAPQQYPYAPTTSMAPPNSPIVPAPQSTPLTVPPLSVPSAYMQGNQFAPQAAYTHQTIYPMQGNAGIEYEVASEPSFEPTYGTANSAPVYQPASIMSSVPVVPSF